MEPFFTFTHYGIDLAWRAVFRATAAARLYRTPWLPATGEAEWELVEEHLFVYGEMPSFEVDKEGIYRIALVANDPAVGEMLYLDCHTMAQPGDTVSIVIDKSMGFEWYDEEELSEPPAADR